MNKQFQKIIKGLEHHAGIANWRCWNDDDSSSNNRDAMSSESIMPSEYCPYFDEKNCNAVLLTETINLLKEYDSALWGMVYQYCTEEYGEKEEFFHRFMPAGEEAFKVLGIENGEEVTAEFVWGKERK